MFENLYSRSVCICFSLHVHTSFAFAATVIRDEIGFTLENARIDMLGSASKITITKDSTLIVTDRSNNEAVKERVSQLQRLVEVHLSYFKINRHSRRYFF